MTNLLQPARLDWSRGTPYSIDFEDVYFSTSGAVEESQHVFLQQNDLLSRFRTCHEHDSFTIAETGFGTGLNWLTAVTLWQQESSAGWLHYISVEKHPLKQIDLAKAHAYWPEFDALSSSLLHHYPHLLPGFHRIVFPQWRTTLTLFFGDVSELLGNLDAHIDAWFLDGFAPDRNPEMWSPQLFENMVELSNPQTTFATFTAAGHVRRGLQAAGFFVEKVPGHGQKREMLRGTLTASSTTSAITPWLHRPNIRRTEKTALVIGAGVAGASVAARMAMRGWNVTVIDGADKVAAGGSGNPAAILYPKIGSADQIDTEFSQQAWLFSLALLESGTMPKGIWNSCGVLQLLTPHQQRSFEGNSDHPWIPSLVKPKSAEASSDIAGIKIDQDTLWYPSAGWLDAQAYCHYLLDHPRITLMLSTHVSELKRLSNGWSLFDSQQNLIAESAVVIAANGICASEWAETNFLPLKPVPGQISTMAASPVSASLKTVICHEGYISPRLPDGSHCLGASFHPGSETLAVTAEDHLVNYHSQQVWLPDLMESLPPPSEWQGRAAMRCQSPDYLPLVGPVAGIESFCQDYAGLRDGKVLPYPLLKTQPGLYITLAHGSRGFGQSLLCAEIIASEICREPAPVSRKVLNALHPMRFSVRDLKRNRI